MSPLLGRVEAALAWREGRAPGMASTPGAITPLSAFGALAVGRGGSDRRRGRGAQRARQGTDGGLQLARLPALVLRRALPIAAGITAGREDESGRGGRRGEERVLIEDDETAIEELAQLDATAGVGVAVRSRRDLEPAGGQPHRVVPRDDARV